MSLAMDIYLTHQVASEIWGRKASFSFKDENVFIHLKVDEPYRVQSVARSLVAQGVHRFNLCGDWSDEQIFSFHQGAFSDQEQIHIQHPRIEDKQTDLSRLLTITRWVRRTINLPADQLTPVLLAQETTRFFEEQVSNAISTRIITGEDLQDQGFMGIYTVGKGSVEPPALLEVDYNPTGDESMPVSTCLVGKGITFDSGGYSLKPSDSMVSMKSDMGGAASVAGGLALAIGRGLSARVKLYLCCAENMVSGRAFRLGDIIHYSNGLRVEILNTDAEGRLVLADGFLAASKTKASVLIDAATLTGSAKIAVGREYNAVFSKDPRLSQQVTQFAQEEHEHAWALPLASWHEKQLTSAFADLANVSTAEGVAGASTAAAFLAQFVGDDVKTWVHLDLSGSYQPSSNAFWAAGAKGHGVRTIARMISEFTMGSLV